MKKYNYFEVPTQVKFWDIFNERYIGGIGYQDKIICGCCGMVTYVSDLIKDVPDTLEEGPIVVYNNWVDIGSEICEDDN